MMSVLKYYEKVFLAQYADDEAEPSFSEVVVRGMRGPQVSGAMKRFVGNDIQFSGIVLLTIHQYSRLRRTAT